MKIKDLENGSTWVIGVQGFMSSVFARFNAPAARWQWTSNLLKARTFKTRELAEQCLKEDPCLRGTLKNTMPDSEWPRVRALKVELKVGG